jgi:hypothetical protein
MTILEEEEAVDTGLIRSHLYMLELPSWRRPYYMLELPSWRRPYKML